MKNNKTKIKSADNFIPLSEPVFSGREWKYVKDCIDTGWVSSTGKYVEQFEEVLAKYTGSKYAIACVNGTSALHISLILAGVKQYDEVIVPTLTFIAPINAVRYLGAEPLFMDSDKFYNIDTEKTIEFIKKETKYINGHTVNKKTGKVIRAIIPVHIFGNAVWMDELYVVCKERNIKIVEDASESLGTFYTKGKFKGRHTGTLGQSGCISFNGNKIITTGGGGMIVTNDKKIAEKAKYLTTQAKDDAIRYIHHEVGYNYRLTNIQAALGVAQMEKLDDYLNIKKANYLKYKSMYENNESFSIADVPEYANNNYWMYALVIKGTSITVEDLLQHLRIIRIQTRPLWGLNHQQKPFKKFNSYKIRNSKAQYESTLNIPCSVNLSGKDIKDICKAINKILL